MTTHADGSASKEIETVVGETATSALLSAGVATTSTFSTRNQAWRAFWRNRFLYLLMAPTLIYFVIFKYGPLWNAQIAFKDFKPLLGVWGSPWVGFQHFETFVNSFYFSQLIANTIFFSTAKLILGLPLAVLLALMLHEVLLKRFRTVVQTIVYLPHFLSWVIMFGVLLLLLSASAVVAAPEPAEDQAGPTGVRLRVTVYQVDMPNMRVPDLDAAELADKSKAPPDFREALKELPADRDPRSRCDSSVRRTRM